MATETTEDRAAQSEPIGKTPHVRVSIVGTGFSGLGLRRWATYPLRPRAVGGGVGQGPRPLAHRDEPVVIYRRRPRARQWTAQRAIHPDDSRSGALRGNRLPFGAVEPRPRP